MAGASPAEIYASLVSPGDEDIRHQLRIGYIYIK